MRTRWCVGAIVALIVGTACGSDTQRAVTSEATGPSTSVADSTSSPVPATTDASPTTGSVAPATSETDASTSTAVPTTTVSNAGAGFDPPCTERAAAGAGSYVEDPALAMFGPIGEKPAMEIAIPIGRAAAGVDPQPASAWTRRIPGGFLIAINSSSSAPTVEEMLDAGAITVLDDDGSVRWQHCLDHRASVFVAPSVVGPAEALVRTADFHEGELHWQWAVVRLDDGSMRPLADLLAASGITGPEASNDRQIGYLDGAVVLGPSDDHVIDTATDLLVRIDLATMTASTLPFPPMTDGQSVYQLYVGTSDDDRLLLLGPDADGMMIAPIAVESDGRWSSDPADLRAAQRVFLDFGYIGGQILRADDGAHTEIWERPDIASFGGEGFRWAIAGDVAIVSGCDPADDPSGPNGPCGDSWLYGLDVDTGATVWRLPGSRGIGPIGDGYALITDESNGTDPAPWIMIDTATGETVPGSSWDEPYSFGTECCGGDEYVHTELDGGIVTAAYEQTLRIWLPAAMTPPAPIRLSLP